jgi:hypothetical protein
MHQKAPSPFSCPSKVDIVKVWRGKYLVVHTKMAHSREASRTCLLRQQTIHSAFLMMAVVFLSCNQFLGYVIPLTKAQYILPVYENSMLEKVGAEKFFGV